MKIFDCFMFFDEEIILELRLNILNEFVDYFVIIESNFTHKGEKRELKFDIKKFEKFKDKIIYLIYDTQPQNVEKILDTDNEAHTSWKYISNAVLRENGQRNFIISGLTKADKNDFVLISDVDEIPNLEKIDLNNINKKIILFNQDMFYYKFNLKMPDLIWSGTKGCKMKDLESPQWLRNVKDKKYSLLRLDIIFSKIKYNSIKFIKNGGWHFSNIKSPKEIEHKLKSYLHHREFDEEPLSLDQIDSIIKNKQAIYDLKVDKTVNKVGSGSKLVNYSIDKLPVYLKENKEIYKKWLD